MNFEKGSTFSTWILILALFLYFLAFSGFAYFTIGDKGPPDWDFGLVKDVPAASPYAAYKELPYPQHVRGKQGE